MLFVPLQSVPSQTISVTLASQSCQLNVYEKQTYSQGQYPGDFVPTYLLFMDVYVNESLIIGGVLCLNLVRIVRDAYLGFSGDFAFYDTQGTDDPVSSGLGSRFQLVYFSESELVQASV